MSRRQDQERSVGQRVANRGRERRLSRDDAFTAYAMDRLLCRLGKSTQAPEFFLKGGVLVANLIDAAHRFTRDIDFLRRHGPADPEDLRQRFREVVAVPLDDGVVFEQAGVRAVTADHAEDGYDGVKVFVRTRVSGHHFDLRIDIGFGDALEPPATRIELQPFLDSDEPARLLAYGPGPVLAEKIETRVSKFPAVQHRIKDLLDVVALSATLDFDGAELLASLRATLIRRGTSADIRVLDDLRTMLAGRRWKTDWATMLREKAVAEPVALEDAIAKFDAFVRPLLSAMSGGVVPLQWRAPGPRWS
jgi:hypothetical protein